MLKLLAVPSLIAGAALLAAPDVTPGGSPAQVTLQAAAPAFVTLNFKGGTLAEYAAAIRLAQPGANIVITDEAAACPVPAVSLRQASVHEAVGLLDKLRTGTHGNLEVDGVGEVYTVSLVGASRDELTLVQSVASTLQSVKADDLLSAINAALESSGGSATLKYHPETSLLIIRGKQGDLDAVSQTLQQLKITAGTRSWGESFEALQERVAQLEARIAAMEHPAKPAGN